MGLTEEFMSVTVTGIRYGGHFPGMSVVADAPVGRDGDKLTFSRYVDPLISVLTDDEQQTPFTIGVFGPWGSGKSSLLRMISDELEQKHPDEFVCVRFNPWVYRGEPNILVPLLHTLRDTLAQDSSKRFVASVKRIGEVLVNLAADVFLKAVTADSVSLEKLEELEQKYIERRFLVESTMRNLHETLKDQVAAIRGSGARRIVLLVDDLDRCEPDQIISLLDSVKLFLDLEHVFVILAVDREVVRRGIQVRYKDFKFSLGRDEIVGHEYLEKMVQLPIELFPLDVKQVEELIESMLAGDDHKEVRGLLKKVVLPNARKIKRLVNTYAFVRSLMLADGTLKSLDRLIVLRLIALQVQNPELYWEAVRLPSALEALEKTYDGTFKSASDYGVYPVSIREPIQKLCERYYQPASALSFIFEKSTFSKIEPKLMSQYLSMLGGRSV